MDLDILSNDVLVSYSKDCIAISSDLVNFFKSSFTRQIDYLNEPTTIALDSIPPISSIFTKVPAVSGNLNYYFGSKSAVARSISSNILKGISKLAATENMPFTNNDKMSAYAYYDFLRGVLSNASIPMSNVRKTTFTVLSAYEPNKKYSEMYPNSQLLCVDITRDMLLTLDSINNKDSDKLSNSLHSNDNYATSSYIGTSGFIELLEADSEWRKYILSRPTELSPSAQVGYYDEYGDFSLSNETNCLSIAQIDEFSKQYVNALRYIKDYKQAKFIDQETNLSVNIVYHIGKALTSNTQCSVLVHAYSSNDIISLSAAFPPSSYIEVDNIFYEKFLGWTISANEASKIRLIPGSDKVIVQDKDLHLWAAYPPMLIVTYNRNGYNILAGNNDGWDTNTHRVFSGANYTIKDFGYVGNASKERNSLVFVSNDVKNYVLQRGIFKNYSTNKNATTGTYAIGSIIKTAQNIVLYPIFYTQQTINVKKNECVFYLRYGKGGPYVVTSKTNTGGATVVSWPIPNSINVRDQLGPLLNYAARLRVLFSGNINERSGAHAPDSERGGYCKVLANVYTYDAPGKPARILNTTPLYAFEFYRTYPKNPTNTDPTRFSYNIVDNNTMKWTQASEWIRFDSGSLKNCISVGLEISAYAPKSTSGCNGYFGIRGLTVDFN